MMVLIAFLAALIFPIVFLLNMPPLTQQLVAAIGFSVASIATANVLFLPKAFNVIRGHEITMTLGINKPPPKIGVESPVAGEDEVKKKLRGLAADDKVRVCAEQLAKWQAALMNAQTGTSGGRSSSLNASGQPQLSRGLSHMPSVIEVGEGDIHVGNDPLPRAMSRLGSTNDVKS